MMGSGDSCSLWQDSSSHLKLGVFVRCLFEPFTSSGEKPIPVSMCPSCRRGKKLKQLCFPDRSSVMFFHIRIF